MKKLFVLMLALAMVISLAACGGKEKTPSGGDNTLSGGSNESTSDDADSSDGKEDSGKVKGENMKAEVGVALDEVKPDDAVEANEKYTSWGGWTASINRGRAPDEEFMLEYLKKIYALTASVSEGGTNYKPTGDVENVAYAPELVPAGSFDEEVTEWDYGAAWYYKYDGEVIYATVSYQLNSHLWFEVGLKSVPVK